MRDEKMLIKHYLAKAEKSDDDNTAIAIISTIDMDRDKEVMLPKGAKIERWIKSPRVMWAHDYEGEPIGKGYWLKKSRDNLKSKWEWAPTESAQQKRLLWDNSFLDTVSIGFLIEENGWHVPTEKELKEHPEWKGAKRIIDKWELLEFSVVPIPSNPNARRLKDAIRNKQISISEELQKELGLDKIDNGEEFYACSCGCAKSDLLIDKTFENDIHLKPEETEDYIHIPVRSKNDFVDDSFRTIDISKKEGISAVIGKLKSDPQGSTHVQKYLFDKAKGWTMEKAKRWVEEHKKNIPIYLIESVILNRPITLKPFIDTDEISQNVIKKLKGQMF